jgi:hypothetical protein
MIDRRSVLIGAPFVAREHPHELELVPVGIGAVDALGGAVARLSGVGVGVEERGAGGSELVDGVELPGEVVEADGALSPWSVASPDTEETEVVVVPERGSRKNAALARGSRAMTTMPNSSV